jgi:hypothetical protein
MTTLNDLAKEASKLLNDSGHCDGEYDFTRWSQSELASYGKMGLAMLFSLVPKKFTKIIDFTLKPGTIQELPEGCTKVVKVLNTNGVAASSSIANSASDRISNLFSDSCSGAVDSFKNPYVVKNFSLEETSDGIFYVNPPVPQSEAPVTVKVICYSMGDFDAKTTEVPPWAWNSVLEWMLYRAYQSEDESQNSMSQMETHLKNFYIIADMLNNVNNILTPGGNPVVRTAGNEPS